MKDVVGTAVTTSALERSQTGSVTVRLMDTGLGTCSALKDGVGIGQRSVNRMDDYIGRRWLMECVNE